MDDAVRTDGRVLVWANPAAGKGAADSVARFVVGELQRRGYRVDLLPTESTAATTAAARDAIADGADRIVVLGGDGTVHQAIQVAGGNPVAFGIVPVGSGNDFAGAVGVPMTPTAALDTALAPATPVDLIRVGDRYAATVATLGISVAVTRRADTLRWPRGAAKYTLATLLEMPALQHYPLILDIDGVRHEVEPNLLAIANTSMFGGGMKVAPSADPCDGVLDIVLLGPAPRRTMLTLLPKAKSGGHVGHRSVTMMSGRRIELHGEQPFRVDADGEPIVDTPVTIEVVPGALRLARPV